MKQGRTLFSSYRNSKREEEEEDIYQETQRQLDQLCTNSQLFSTEESLDSAGASSIPTLDSPQCLCLADVCGMGQFGVVVEVGAIFSVPQIHQTSRRSTIFPHRHQSRSESHTSDTATRVTSNPSLALRPTELSKMRNQLTPTTPMSPRRRSSVLRMEARTLENLLNSTSKGLLTGSEENPYQEKRKQKLQSECLASDGTPRYVAKRIRQDLYPAKKLQAVVDLAKEGKWLALPSLQQHANICTLYAHVGTPGRLDYMLILEKLGKTLHDVIETEWKPADKLFASPLSTSNMNITRPGTIFSSFWSPTVIDKSSVSLQNTYTVQSLLSERIGAVLDISRAMHCLHQNHILMRDLKTENLAFTISTSEQSSLKLFDFGLARECRYPVEDEGMVGTIRIMAPEVIQGIPYGLKADVYSFAITVVEMFSCEDPHLGVDLATHIQNAISNIRPPRPDGMPEVIWKLVRQCWEQDPEDRPAFDDISSALEEFSRSLPGYISPAVAPGIVSDKMKVKKAIGENTGVLDTENLASDTSSKSVGVIAVGL